MSEYQIADRPALESLWRRAWVDAKSFSNSWYLWMFEVALGGSATILPIVFNYQVITIVVISSIGLSAVPVAVFVTSVCRVPFKQRSEARREALRLLELREPKLKVSIEPGRPLYDLSAESQAHDLIYSFGLRIRNESDGVANGCVATVLEIDAIVKYLPRVTKDGCVERQRDDFDIGLISSTKPRPLLWQNEATTGRLLPRGETVIDIFHYMWSGERPIKIQTPYSGDLHELENDGTLFLISVGAGDCLPMYGVYEYLPNTLSGENWSLKYVGPNQPALKDYQSFEQIES